jgi:cytidine deaminase
MNTLPPHLSHLIRTAWEARQRAYAPYSHFLVGAALLCADGTVFTGCNVENASYGGTICAERTAFVKAISEGRRDFIAVAVSAGEGDTTPCGICRQFMYEFAPDLTILIADSAGKFTRQYTLRALLPDGFGPVQLGRP